MFSCLSEMQAPTCAEFANRNLSFNRSLLVNASGSVVLVNAQCVGCFCDGYFSAFALEDYFSSSHFVLQKIVLFCEFC